MQVKLKVLAGSQEGKEVLVTSEKFLIGRSSSCQLRPKSESVSRKHCILVIKDGKALVQDLKSRNGTFINEKRLPVDRAKVLKGGDHLKVGRLEFEVVIEHGLGGVKRPEVSDVGDAAARTVESGSGDSRFEAVDVSAWLEEADQVERVRSRGEDETRQFRLDQIVTSEEGADDSSLEDPSDLSIDDSKAEKKKGKKEYGKLPDHVKKKMKENSRDAADDALKKFFMR